MGSRKVTLAYCGIRECALSSQASTPWCGLSAFLRWLRDADKRRRHRDSRRFVSNAAREAPKAGSHRGVIERGVHEWPPSRVMYSSKLDGYDGNPNMATPWLAVVKPMSVNGIP